MKKAIVWGLMAGLLVATGAQAAEVSGFRSARFGDTEKQVAEAAVKDLKIKATDLKRSEDPAAKVTLLSAQIKDFDPLNLPARVTYVLGYKCQCLTQVTVGWEFPEKATVEQRKTAMIGLAALVEHFEKQGWEKDEVVKNRIPGEVKENSESGVIFFRAQNKKGGAITMAGGPVKMMKPEKDANLAANVDDLKNVLLSYEKDATNPDVHRVDVSGF